MADYTDFYNTQLSPKEEAKFNKWRAKLPPQLNTLQDYDLRGAWKAGAKAAENGHLPDRFKKPNHPTFSDESIYSGKDGLQGGHWSTRPDGTWTFSPGATNLRLYSRDQLTKYFQTVEPNSVLILPEVVPTVGAQNVLSH